MALLVRAVAVRRLRSRSILAACIVNETLGDDAAYDTACTTSIMNHYKTFEPDGRVNLENLMYRCSNLFNEMVQQCGFLTLCRS